MDPEKLPFISFILLAALLAGRIAFLKRRKIQTSGKGEGKSKFNPLAAIVFLIIFLLWIFELSRAAFEFSLTLLPNFLLDKLVDSSFIQGVGTVFIVVGLIAFALTLFQFGNSLRFGLDSGNKGKLVTTGIFSLSRNPFFLSLEIYFLGTTLIIPSLFLIGFTLSAIVGIHFFIMKEERFMLENYSDEYRKYSRKTRRYL